jgi:hypothetical protein
MNKMNFILRVLFCLISFNIYADNNTFHLTVGQTVSISLIKGFYQITSSPLISVSKTIIAETGNWKYTFKALNTGNATITFTKTDYGTNTYIFNITTAYAQTQSDFQAALTRLGATPTPTKIGIIISQFSTSPYAYYLIDYPSSTTGLFALIQSNFFNADNSLKLSVTGATLTALQTLLCLGIPPYVAPNPNLIFLLSPSELATVKAWLANINKRLQ